MRILHFSWEYPPVMYGGLGAHVVALTQEQARAGHDVCVITQAPPDVAASEEVLAGVRVIRVDNHYPDAHFSEQGFDHWVNGFALACIAAFTEMADKPEIVHGHDWIAARQLSSVSSRFAIPSVLTIHATEFGRHNGWLTSRLSRMIYAYEHCILHTSDAVIVCSEFMRAEVVNAYGLKAGVAEVIPNAITHISQSQRKTSTDDSQVVVGFIGRLEWEKGVHHIIDSLTTLEERHIKLQIVGVGGQLQSLKDKVARRGLVDRVEFVGHVDAATKATLMSDWDAAVIPSTYEPFGIVALELGQAGVPLVVSRVGGLVDIVPSFEYGYRLAEPNGACIAAELEQILADPGQAVLRAQKLQARIARDFTWESVASQTARVYATVCS